MSDVQIKKVMETDESGVQRQIFPETHVSAINGLEELTSESVSKVTSVNGKIGDVNITLQDLGISIEMFEKLKKVIEAFDDGTLGNANIEIEKVKED